VNPALFHELLTPGGQELLRAAEGLASREEAYLSALGALRRAVPGASRALAGVALDTALLRARARRKFSRAPAMYFTREALEQATTEAVGQPAGHGCPEEHPDEAGAHHDARLRGLEPELGGDRREQERDEDDVHRVEEPAEAADDQQLPVEPVQRNGVQPRDEGAGAHGSRGSVMSAVKTAW